MEEDQIKEKKSPTKEKTTSRSRSRSREKKAKRQDRDKKARKFDSESDHSESSGEELSSRQKSQTMKNAENKSLNPLKNKTISSQPGLVNFDIDAGAKTDPEIGDKSISLVNNLENLFSSDHYLSSNLKTLKTEYENLNIRDEMAEKGRKLLEGLPENMKANQENGRSPKNWSFQDFAQSLIYHMGHYLQNLTGGVQYLKKMNQYEKRFEYYRSSPQRIQQKLMKDEAHKEEIYKDEKTNRNVQIILQFSSADLAAADSYLMSSHSNHNNLALILFLVENFEEIPIADSEAWQMKYQTFKTLELPEKDSKFDNEHLELLVKDSKFDNEDLEIPEKDSKFDNKEILTYFRIIKAHEIFIELCAKLEKNYGDRSIFENLRTMYTKNLPKYTFISGELVRFVNQMSFYTGSEDPPKFRMSILSYLNFLEIKKFDMGSEFWTDFSEMMTSRIPRNFFREFYNSYKVKLQNLPNEFSDEMIVSAIEMLKRNCYQLPDMVDFDAHAQTYINSIVIISKHPKEFQLEYKVKKAHYILTLCHELCHLFRINICNPGDYITVDLLTPNNFALNCNPQLLKKLIAFGTPVDSGFFLEELILGLYLDKLILTNTMDYEVALIICNVELWKTGDVIHLIAPFARNALVEDIKEEKKSGYSTRREFSNYKIPYPYQGYNYHKPKLALLR